MRISEVERATGCTRHTIRFYEAQGIIDAPRRDDNNYRAYDPDVVGELTFIRMAQDVGFTLAEIRAIVASRRASTLDCVQGAELVDGKIAEIGLRITRLRRMKAELETTRADLVASALDNALQVPDRLRKYADAR